ncbi:MAG: hypothetical protein LBT48_06000 [Prevotellaceae bacterium]|jgi:hypothetical protein|nr:hypothetical protein [Prevotellaceae bacterium]
MKKTLQKGLLFLLTAGGLWTVSCMDDKLDLDNVSLTMRAEGTYAIPLIYSKITIRDLIGKYGGDTTGVAVLDSTTGVHPGLIALFYENESSYAMRDFNQGFYDADLRLNDLDIQIPQTGFHIEGLTLTGNINLNSSVPLQSPDDSHYIDHVDFKQLSGTIELDTDGGDIELDSIRIGGKEIKIVDNQFSADELTLYEGGTFTLVYDYNGGEVNVDYVNIKISSTAFVAWGWFDYTFRSEDTKSDSVNADLKKFLGENSFDVYDPQFEFSVSNYNVGVPLILNLQNINDLQFNGGDGHPFTLISPSEINTTSTISGLCLNRDSSETMNFDRTKYSSLITSELKTVSTKYDFYSKPIDVENPEERGDMQFIASDGSLDVKIKAIVPLWINKRYFSYTDTVQLNVEQAEDNEKIVIDDNATITLRFSYKSHLPFDMNIRMSLLDKNNVPITIGGQAHKEPSASFKGGKLGPDTVYDADGESKIVTEATDGELDITLTHQEYKDLQQASSMLLTFYSDGEPVVLQMRTSDYLEVRTGAIITGGVIIKQ